MLNMNKESYTKLIQEDIDLVNKKLPDGIIKDHINLVLCDSIDMHYPEVKKLDKTDVIGSVCFNCSKPIEYERNGLPKYRCECGAVKTQTVL